MDGPAHNPWVCILSQALYGHTQAVTCLAASVTFSLLVSGSQDRTCILWDLDRLVHVVRLPAHREGISAISISDVSVRLPVCVCGPARWHGGRCSKRRHKGRGVRHLGCGENTVCGPFPADERVQPLGIALASASSLSSLGELGSWGVCPGRGTTQQGWKLHLWRGACWEWLQFPVDMAVRGLTSRQ